MDVYSTWTAWVTFERNEADASNLKAIIVYSPYNEAKTSSDARR